MNDNCIHWFYLCLAFLFVILAGLVMVFKYFLKINRKGVVLEQNDRQHEYKHKENEQKIKILEQKNGHEQKQIDQLRTEISELKEIIRRNQIKK